MDFSERINAIGFDYKEEREFIPTGLVVFDSVLSKGRGIPRGTFIEVASDSGLGKTTMLLHCCRNLAAAGYNCMLS